MKGKALQDIRIEWEGPFSLYDIGYNEEKDSYELKNAKLNNDSIDYGVYQIYGFHPLYGQNVLLYIGKAQDQTFAKRISQEAWDYNLDYRNVQIYVGRFYNMSNSDPFNQDGAWNNIISHAEKLLIYAHGPAANSSNIQTITRDDTKIKQFENMRILNYGTHRSLMPEVSGEMWVRKFGDIKLFGE